MQGWKYQESNTTCCGKCLQFACVVDGILKMPNETWTAPDNNCTKFTCEVFGDEFLTASQQETCPELEDCPKENIYMKGCCQFCNKTAESQSKF